MRTRRNTLLLKPWETYIYPSSWRSPEKRIEYQGLWEGCGIDCMYFFNICVALSESSRDSLQHFPLWLDRVPATKAEKKGHCDYTWDFCVFACDWKQDETKTKWRRLSSCKGCAASNTWTKCHTAPGGGKKLEKKKQKHIYKEEMLIKLNHHVLDSH